MGEMKIMVLFCVRREASMELVPALLNILLY